MKEVAATPARKRSRGITLLELMIALVIITVSLFAILSMVLNMMAMRESAREKELAKEWVQQKLEEVKSRPFTDLKTVAYPPAGGATLYTATFGSPSTPAHLSNAAGVLAVDYSNADLYEVVASITWKGRMGNGSYSMRNLYAK